MVEEGYNNGFKQCEKLERAVKTEMTFCFRGYSFLCL